MDFLILESTSNKLRKENLRSEVSNSKSCSRLPPAGVEFFYCNVTEPNFQKFICSLDLLILFYQEKSMQKNFMLLFQLTFLGARKVTKEACTEK